MAARNATVHPRLLRDVLRQPLPPAAISAFDYYGRLRDLEDFTLGNFDCPIGRNVAARIAGLEPAPFSRFFRAKTGLRFINWLIAIRVAYATWHLERRDVALCYLAIASGFRDERSLRRAFVRVHGICPRRFRTRLMGLDVRQEPRGGTPVPIVATNWPVLVTNPTPAGENSRYISDPTYVGMGGHLVSPDS